MLATVSSHVSSKLFFSSHVADKPASMTLRCSDVQEIGQRIFESKKEIETLERSLYPWQKWVQQNAKETGVMSTVARFILLVLPALSRKFSRIDFLNTNLRSLQSQLVELEEAKSEGINNLSRESSDLSLNTTVERAQQNLEVVESLIEMMEAEDESDRRVTFAAHDQVHEFADEAQMDAFAKSTADSLAAYGLRDGEGSSRRKSIASAPSSTPILSLKHENSHEEILDAIKQDGRRLKDYPEYQNDKMAVQLALKGNLNALEFVSKELRGDKDIALLIVGYNGLLLKDLSDALKNDTAVVARAITQNYKAFEYASKDLKKNTLIQGVYGTQKKTQTEREPMPTSPKSPKRGFFSMFGSPKMAAKAAQ